MTSLTIEEKKRAWDRLKRGGYSPILLGACSGSDKQAEGGSAIHLAKGLDGMKESLVRNELNELVEIATRAVSLVSRRVFVDRREVQQFIDRHLREIVKASEVSE